MCKGYFSSHKVHTSKSNWHVMVEFGTQRLKIASRQLYSVSWWMWERLNWWCSASIWDSKSDDPGFDSHYCTTGLVFILSFKIHNNTYIESPVELIPKQNSNNDTHLIFHLSWPENDSVNFHTPKEFCSVKYKDLEHAITYWWCQVKGVVWQNLTWKLHLGICRYTQKTGGG